MIRWLVTLLGVALSAAVALPWLRVAQREHYAPGQVSRFALRWFRVGRPFPALRGRTSKLAWTRHLRTVAGVTALVVLPLVAVPGGTVIAAALMPMLVDVALWVTRPFEQRLARGFVVDAERKLRQVAPTIVAITGSYGKTSTKQYVRHLVAGSRAVVASPASFNNTAGLSRTVNEHLTPGTEVLVAEMGAYGPGEITDLCAWVRPTIGVITAIGPVHLERYGSVEAVVRAKSEIAAEVEAAVLNIDAYGMGEVAAEVAASGRRVIRCSALDAHADAFAAVIDGDLVVSVYGAEVARMPHHGQHPTNVACAVGVALALGIDPPDFAGRLAELPTAEHRQQVVVAPSGVTVIDDTFNANPAGAAAALALLTRHRHNLHRAVVVTPGMIELGAEQDAENEHFAAAASHAATDVIVVGRSNRAALLRGAGHGPATVHTVATRDEAVAWVRAHLTHGDVVLYENDLPDHYP